MHTLHGFTNSHTPVNSNNLATPEGRRLFGEALRAVAALASYCEKRGNIELAKRAENACDALLAGQCVRPIETDDETPSGAR